MKNEKGFTLIELLVVIAIIGILSSVVLASLNSARAKSRDARRLADIQQVKLAAELYFDSHGFYPQTIAALVTDGQMASEPEDPLTGASYSYEPNANPATDYCLGTTIDDTNQATSTSNTACETSLGGTVNYAVAP